MSTYICHECDVEIRISNRNSAKSAFANVCPVCESDDALEYL